MLFGLYSFVGKRSHEAPETIVVSAARVANLADGFARTWQRPPSSEELSGLIEDYVRDEVFYRAGKDIGLDREDVIIRRRVRQKMELLAEELSAPEPTEEQLLAYLASHPERFRTEDRLTFRHVFLSATSHSKTIDADVKQVSALLSSSSAPIDPVQLGDPLPFDDEYRAMTRRDMASTFGDSFARKVFAAEMGRWQGPITSSYGQHFVMIEERTDGIVPPLDAIRSQVVREWTGAQRIDAEQKLYRSLRDRYQIKVETAAPARSLTAAHP